MRGGRDRFLPGDRLWGKENVFPELQRYSWEKIADQSVERDPGAVFPGGDRPPEAGIVDVKPLISHRFALEDAPEALKSFIADRNHGVKAMMVSE